MVLEAGGIHRKVIASEAGRRRAPRQYDFWQSLLDSPEVNYSFQRLLREHPVDAEFLPVLFECLSKLYVALRTAEQATPGGQVARSELDGIVAPVVKVLDQAIEKIERDIEQEVDSHQKKDRRRRAGRKKVDPSAEPLFYSSYMRKKTKEWFEQKVTGIDSVSLFMRSLSRTLIGISRHRRDNKKSISDTHRVITDLDVIFEPLYTNRKPPYMNITAVTPWAAYQKAQAGLEHELESVASAAVMRQHLKDAQRTAGDQVQAIGKAAQYQKPLPSFSEVAVEIADARDLLTESSFEAGVLGSLVSVSLEHAQTCAARGLVADAAKYLQYADLLMKEIEEDARENVIFIERIVLGRLDFNCFRRNKDIQDLADIIAGHVRREQVNLSAAARVAQVITRHHGTRGPEMALVREAAYGIVSCCKQFSARSIRSIGEYAQFIQSRCIDAHRLLEFRRAFRKQPLWVDSRRELFARTFADFVSKRTIMPQTLVYHRCHALFYMALFIPCEEILEVSGKPGNALHKAALDLYEIVAAENLSYLTATNARSRKSVKEALRAVDDRQCFYQLSDAEKQKIIASLAESHGLSHNDTAELHAMLPQYTE